MYAKLINKVLRRAPNKVTYNGRLYCNPTEDILKELGYQKVTYTECPSNVPEGYHYESSWTQGEDEIIQEWNLVEAPVYEEELSTEEALAIIVGGV